MIQFFISGPPPTTTHQQKQVTVVKGKPRFYEPPPLKTARAKLVSQLAQYRPSEPLSGPLRMTAKWCFPAVKGSTDGQYKPTKPDTDNLQKLLKDCCTYVGFWLDDAQVASEIVEKFYAETPGIFIRIEQL